MSFPIQRCTACGTAGYPRRSLCRACLADALVDEAAGAGRLLAATTLHRSLEPDYAGALPLRIGTVLLDAGPHLIAYLAAGLQAGDRVRIVSASNPLGDMVARAVADDG